MRKLLFLLLLSLCCIFMFSLGGIPQTDGDNKKVQFVINTAKVKTLHGELYGFNTNMIHGIWGYTDKSIVDVTSSLKPNVLRFPGGTIGNFYHWKNAGFNKRELDASTIKWLSNAYETLREKRKGIISFDEFMVLCNKFNIKPIIVVNLYTGTPSESAEWVRYVKDKGYKVFGWELGNELNFPMYKDKIKNIDGYITIAKKHADAMKAVDPNIRIAVVAHPGAFDVLDVKRELRAEAWDKKLSKERFFDAFSSHLYLDIDKFDLKKAKKDVTSMRDDLFEISDAILEKSIKTYKQIFGNKEMWVTEWNIMFKGNKDIADTLLHALYCGDFFVNMANSDMITDAEYHILAGPWNGFPLISSKGKDADNIVKRACYYPFFVIKDAMSESHRKFSLTIENNPLIKQSNKYTGSPVYGISAASIGTEKKVFVLVANRTSGDLTANLEINRTKYGGNIKYSYVTAESLDSKGEQNRIEVKTKVDSTDKLILPANSFGLIEILR